MFSSRHEAAAVESFLRRRFAGVSAVEPLGGGEWSQAFSFRTGDQDRVIRFGRFPEDYEKDRLAAGFNAPDLPVPQVHEIGEALGAAYAISTRAPGVGFDTLDEAGYRRVLPALLRAWAALRAADVSGSAGYGIWRPDGSAPFASWREFLLDVECDPASSRTHGWRSRLYTVPAAAARFEEGRRQLQGLLDACPEDRHLIHADLVGDNLRVEGDRITAVVDWANAMYGDFLYDLARLTFFAPWFPELRRIDVRGLGGEHFASVPDFDERLRCCEVHVGLDAQAYNAFSRRWDELARSGKRTLELARRS